MAFKPIIRDPLSRTYAMTDAAWEFDAPKFYDFSRVDDEEDVHEFDYFSVDHEAIRARASQDGAASNVGPVNAEDAVNSKSPVKNNDIVEGAQAGGDSCHLDMQFDMLNLKTADTAEASRSELNQQCDESTAPSTPRGTARDNSSWQSPSALQDKRGSRQPRFVDTVTSAKKRLSMSVDRGNRRLAKKLAEIVGPAKRALYTVDASPGLNQSIHCLAHGQVAEPDNTDVAKPIKPSDNAIAENIVDGLADGNAKMLEAEEVAHPVEVPYVGIPFLPRNASRTRVQPFSFEERNKRMLASKAEKIRKAVEADRKLREFHAQPFPEIIYSSAPARTAYAHPAAAAQALSARKKNLSGQPKQDKANAENNPPTFRAKQPTVLQKQPFVPQKSTKHTSTSRGMLLKTEDRAARRAEWDRWKKEKDLKFAEKKQERERQEREADEATTRRLRQMTVHRARPVPNFIRQQKKPDKPAAE